MIASTKLSKAQRAMTIAKAYGAANNELFKHAEAPSESANASPRKLFVVVSSDKGLCGGVHSSVSKGTRRIFATGSIAQEAKPGSPEASKEQAGPIPAQDSPIVIIGDKSKAQLSRSMPQNFLLTMNQIGKDIPTFADAAAVADLIVKSGAKYDSVVIVYNKYISAVAFEAATMEILNEEKLKEAREFHPPFPFNQFAYAHTPQPVSQHTNKKTTPQRTSQNSPSQTQSTQP